MKRKLCNCVMSLFLSMFMFSTSSAAVRIMPLGDSITEGVSGSSDSTGYRRSLYRSLVSQGYSVDFVGSQTHGVPTDFDRNHEGHGGWRTNQIRDNIANWLVATPPDVVLLHIGTNDLWHDLQPAVDVAAEVNQILNLIDAYENSHNTPITVVLAQIIDLEHSKATAAQIQVTADYYTAIANLYNTRLANGDRIKLVDMYNALSYPGDMADVAHPNNSGYIKMAGVWLNAVTSILDNSIYNVSLKTSSVAHTTDDDLICSYMAGKGFSAIATSWSISGNPIMELYMPMEGSETNALNDYSGNNVISITNGNVSWSATAGHDGRGAFVFDGTGHIQTSMNFPVGASYTKTAWVYRSADGGQNSIICGDSDSGSHTFQAPATEGYKLSAGHNGVWNTVQDTASLELNTWYFVAVSFNATTGEMVLYKNGVEVDQATSANDVTDDNLLIGAFRQDNGWVGTLDDTRVYNRALSGQQIAAMYNYGQGNNDKIVADETADDEIWQATVITFTSQAVSDIITNTVKIGNSAGMENLSVASASGQNLGNEDILCSYDLTGTSIAAATAWYRCDAPAMCAYMPMEGGATNALCDYSGNEVTATFAGNPLWSATAGHDGHGAFRFDGVDDRITVSENFPMLASYTKTAWVYRSADGADNNIISGDTNTASHAFWAPPSQGYKLSSGHNGAWFTVQDTAMLNLNTWYFVAVTFNAANNEMVLYKNGVQVSKATSSNSVTDTTIAIGSFNNGHLWAGTIDDARVYNYPLSSAQIAAMYNGGTGNNNIIAAAETMDGETWSARVTPFSDIEPGVTRQSNTVTIGGEVALGVDSLVLASTSGNDINSDDILCQYNLSGAATTAAAIWYESDSSLLNFYMPMEGGVTNSLRDIANPGSLGAIVGNPVWSATAGHDGNGAYRFDGTGDHISAGEKLPTTASYTKMAWIYRTSDSGNNNIISGDSVAGGHAFWVPQSVGNKLSAGHDSSWFIVQDTVKMNINTWYFAAVTFDAATGRMILYKNGVEVSRGTAPNSVTDATVLVGSHNHGSLWLGTIDDARVYNCALSGEQIAAMYNA
ncbi:MAG: hypothetical protein JXM68_03130, partial [Sedimentisphaerales bacterium]|nr:hypothetical protein [Sedimentisphaerales bacterium]